MSITHARPADLQPGDRYLVRVADEDVTVQVVRPCEPWTEPFGRPGFFRLWCRRDDTGAEGYMCYGPEPAPVRRT